MFRVTNSIPEISSVDFSIFILVFTFLFKSVVGFLLQNIRLLIINIALSLENASLFYFRACRGLILQLLGSRNASLQHYSGEPAQVGKC